MNKRGISKIVVVVILIALVLVAIALIWVRIRNIILEGTSGVSLGRFTLGLEIRDAYVQGGNLVANIQRKVGKGDLTGIKFIFTDGVNIETATQSTDMEELEGEQFIIDVVELNPSDLTELSIAPIYMSEGEETLGDIVDTYIIGSEKESSGPVCGDGFCSILVECDSGCTLDCSIEHCCGNDVCDELIGENETNCPYDCDIGCTPDCGLRICGPAPNGCGGEDACGTCISGNCSEDGLECIDCEPYTCDDLGYECGEPDDGCGGTLDCGDCEEGQVCESGLCTETSPLNYGTVEDVWPPEDNMYFSSSDLPTEEGTDYTGEYVSYSGAHECLLIADYVLPTYYNQSHIAFNFETEIGVGDSYYIWDSSDICLANL